jgi:hypothetical protein
VADTELINNTLIDAFDMAEKWRSTNTTESHWILVVVGPILHLLRRLYYFQKKNKLGNENITVFDMYVYLSQLRSVAWIYPCGASFANVGFAIAHPLKYLRLSFALTPPNLICLKTSIRKLTMLSASTLADMPSLHYKRPQPSPSLLTRPPPLRTTTLCSLI